MSGLGSDGAQCNSAGKQDKETANDEKVRVWWCAWGWWSVGCVRARWPDLVIALALIALTVVGVVTLFGPAIRGWFAPEEAGLAPLAPSGGRSAEGR